MWFQSTRRARISTHRETDTRHDRKGVLQIPTRHDRKGVLPTRGLTPTLSPLRAKARITRITQNNEKAARLKAAFPEHSGGIFRGVQLRWVQVRGATRTRSLSIPTPSLPPPMRLFGPFDLSSSLMPVPTRPISSSPQPNGTRFSVKHILEEPPGARAPSRHRPSPPAACASRPSGSASSAAMAHGDWPTDRVLTDCPVSLGRIPGIDGSADGGPLPSVTLHAVHPCAVRVYVRSGR